MRPLPLIDGALVVDNSQLVSHDNCPTQHYFAYTMRRVPESRWALTYGGIIHKALECRYKANTPGFSDELLNECIEVLCEKFSKHHPPEGEYRTLENAIRCLDLYQRTYRFETFTTLEINGMQGCETPFMVPLCEIQLDAPITCIDLQNPNNGTFELKVIPVIFCGRVDLFIRTKDKVNAILDHKTTSIGGANYFEEHWTGSQFRGYCWAASELTGEKFRTAFINALVSRRPLKSKLDKFNGELMRQPVTFSDDSIDEWRENAYVKSRAIIEEHQSSIIEQRTAHCKGKYGRCDYYDVCINDRDIRERLLRGPVFTDNIWNPIEELQRKNEKGPMLP